MEKFVCKICKNEIDYQNRSRFIKGCCFDCAKNRRLWGEYFKKKSELREKAKSSQFPTSGI